MIFEPRVYRSTGSSALAQLELIYHCTVQSIRATHRTGGLGIVINIIQVVVLVALFAAVMLTLGMRGSAIRGDFLLYIMSGVFLFKVHVKAIGAVFGADGPTSPMMLHAPMNTIVSIVSSALGALYIQTISLLVILFVYHAAVTPITIEEPVGALAAYLLAWLSGCAGGMVFRAAKPWAPKPVTLVKTVYQRANMFASGKMFLANSIPVFILPWFIWNPLFHAIDQARGFVFLNYNPHHTNMLYPLWFSLALITVGLMGEFFTRKHASASWAA